MVPLFRAWVAMTGRYLGGILSHAPSLVIDELPEYFCDLPDWAKKAVVGHLTRECPDATPAQIGQALSQAAKLTGPTCNLAACLATAVMVLRETRTK